MPGIRTRPEDLPTAVLLAGVGGFLDAYTFVGYRGVFANAQTGNLVLLGVYSQAGHWQQAALRIPPILAFMLGVALAQTLAQPAVRKAVRRPTRWVLAAEIIVLAAVGARPGWVPSQAVPVAVALVSAVQVSTFRSLDGVEYATTVTTGNLRTMIVKAYQWRADHDPASGRQAGRLACVLVAFAVGAGVGSLCTRFLHQRAAWVAAAVLILVLAIIVFETSGLGPRNNKPPQGDVR
jgi:uncharacterized membrane protein YoaK (UPF0700 family)